MLMEICLARGFWKVSQTLHETGKNTSPFSGGNAAFLTGSPHFPADFCPFLSELVQFCPKTG